MPRFDVGQSIPTRVPVIEVDPGMEPGLHRFELRVVTDDGRESKPDVVVVRIRERLG